MDNNHPHHRPYRRRHQLRWLTFLLSLLCFDCTVALQTKSNGVSGLSRESINTGTSPLLAHGDSTTKSTSSSTNSDKQPLPARYPRTAQVRQKPKNRRRRSYWQDISNVEQELRELWEWANVTLASEEAPPPIPNESLLNYWKRHDLRAAIATHEGREFLAETLGGAVIIPGKWNLAVKTPYVQQILAQDSNLSSEFPPLSPQQQKHVKAQAVLGVEVVPTGTNEVGHNHSSATASTTSSGLNSDRQSTRWHHQRTDRKPLGYWNAKTIVIKELYEYLQERRQNERIPEGWMPRLSELHHAGRDDLALAIQRHGGQKAICKTAALVSFREWNYIEGMYEMLLELRKYLDQYHDGDYSTFPVISQIKERGHDRLHSLVQYYGGLRFLADRLDMDYTIGGKSQRSSSTTSMNKNQRALTDMSWGPFDFVFAIKTFAIVREQQMKMKPPLRHPEIGMPSQLSLLEYGEKGLWLDEKIQEYGGYENVARRLGLAFAFRSF